MVGGVDHQAALPEAVGGERRKHLADQLVHARHQSPVGGASALLLGGSDRLDAGGRAPGADERMEPLRERLRMVRRRHATRVAVEVLPARHVRRMRQHQADAEAERRLLAGPAPDPDPVEIVDGGRGHVLVMHLVRRLAGPGVAQADPVRPGGAGQRAHVMRDPADVVGGVVPDQPVDVAVQLVRTDAVHAADQDRTVPGRAHGVRDRRRVGREHVVVRPHPVLVRVAAGEHRHPRRHADRRRAVGRVEHRARRRQGVQVGRVDHGVAVAAGDERIVLVGVDVEQVRDRWPGAGNLVPDAAESAGVAASAASPTELRSQGGAGPRAAPQATEQRY